MFSVISSRITFLQNTRDWNEEISGTRELPRTTLPERLIRERAMFKVCSLLHVFVYFTYSTYDCLNVKVVTLNIVKFKSKNFVKKTSKSMPVFLFEKN